MSGFSASWLDLRAPADARARSEHMLAAARTYCADLNDLAVTDLGAGVGATAMALADILPRPRRWRLVDLDAANLDEAARRLAAAGETVETAVVDLAATPACWGRDCALVTASALFDLASDAWIDRFVDALARDRLALLAMLTYDGRQAFRPQCPDDAAMLAAFNRHQRLDKGLGGPAAGPDAAPRLIDRLESSGYAVVVAQSPWRLDGRRDADLTGETLRGWASAVTEAGLVEGAVARRWLEARLARTDEMTVGHVDLFARPLDAAGE